MNFPLDHVSYGAQGDIRIRAEKNILWLQRGKGAPLAFPIQHSKESTLSLSIPNEADERSLLFAAEFLFGHLESLQTIQSGKEALLTRQELQQNPKLWLTHPACFPNPENWIETNGRAHPRRLPPVAGVMYRRYVPSLGRTISIRLADPQKDLDVFHQWHNERRVWRFWELNKPKEELAEYLKKGLADPHQIPVIIECDGEPKGYFEIYWTPEDRLGPYYEYEPFDRGFHFLIGEKSFLGMANTDAVIKSVMHFIFLDDPRTRKIMAEPRHDNAAAIRYVDVFPVWKKLKEFDFPHKRAALLEAKREAFFGRNFL